MTNFQVSCGDVHHHSLTEVWSSWVFLQYGSISGITASYVRRLFLVTVGVTDRDDISSGVSTGSLGIDEGPGRFADWSNGDVPVAAAVDVDGS